MILSRSEVVTQKRSKRVSDDEENLLNSWMKSSRYGRNLVQVRCESLPFLTLKLTFAFHKAQYEFTQMNSKINSVQKDIAKHKGKESPERDALMKQKAELQQRKSELEELAAAKKTGIARKILTCKSTNKSKN
jgi:hypothetical protein